MISKELLENLLNKNHKIFLDSNIPKRIRIYTKFREDNDTLKEFWVDIDSIFEFEIIENTLRMIYNTYLNDNRYKEELLISLDNILAITASLE